METLHEPTLEEESTLEEANHVSSLKICSVSPEKKAQLEEQICRTESNGEEANQIPQKYSITVAIPTYNGAQRLPKVLERLRTQVNTANISWEVVVADNNSTDDTAAVVRRYQKTWPIQSRLRYCFVATQGAAFARQRAVELATGDIVGFLDDDNVPAQDWIQQACQFAQNHQQVGAFGSQVHGDFESDPPLGFKQISSFLAVIERGQIPHRYEPSSRMLPPAAGLVVRRQVWLDNVPKRLFLNHKGKGAGLASEDLEAILYIQKADWEVWYNPSMVVYHQIPSKRLEREYLLALFRCTGLSRFYIRMLRVKSWQRPLLVPGYIANDLRRLALQLLNQTFHPSSTPLINACQQQYLLSSAISPLFLMKKVSLDVWQELTASPSAEREKWLFHLTRAFEEDEFQLYTQPVVAVGNESIPLKTQEEILLRLPIKTETGDIKLISPRKFLAIATELGLSHTIDSWVIRKFFKLHQLRTDGSEHGIDRTHHVYSLNLSLASISTSKLAEIVDTQVTNFALKPEHVCFELPEMAILSHEEHVSKRIQELKEIGCQVAIDDCLEGKYLKRLHQSLPIDYYKISSKLLDPARPMRHSAKLRYLEAIIHSEPWQDSRAIIKGVANLEMLEQVKQMGIPYAQGFILGKPHPFNPLSIF